eukprot:gene21598-7850_t
MDLSGKSGQSLNLRAAAPSNGLPGQTTMLNSGFEYHNEAANAESSTVDSGGSIGGGDSVAVADDTKATKAQQSSHGSGDGFSLLERWSLLSRNKKFLFGGGAALLLIVIIVVAVVASGGGSSDGSILVDTNSSADTSVGDGSL